MSRPTDTFANLKLSRPATVALAAILAAREVSLANYTRSALRALLLARGHEVSEPPQGHPYKPVHKRELDHSVGMPRAWLPAVIATCEALGLTRAGLLRLAVISAMRAAGYDQPEPEPETKRAVRRGRPRVTVPKLRPEPVAPGVALAAFTARRGMECAMGGGR